MKTIKICIIALVISNSLSAQFNQQTLQLNNDVKIDSIGNAQFEVSGKLTAQQWLAWNYMYGGGQASIVKKNIERSLSPYYVCDFKYTPNEMDRTFSIQYKAKGTVEYLGKDKWVAQVGLKDAQPVKLTENSFNCVTTQANGNIITQTTMKCTLPSDATDMQFDKDEFGNVLVKFKRPTETSIIAGNNNIKMAGYSLTGIGLLSLLAIALKRRKK